jgi:hypothetical protein
MPTRMTMRPDYLPRRPKNDHRSEVDDFERSGLFKIDASALDYKTRGRRNAWLILTSRISERGLEWSDSDSTRRFGNWRMQRHWPSLSRTDPSSFETCRAA